MNIFSRITARTMRQNKTRTIVTIIGVMLSTAMITAVASFGVSFQGFLVDYSISRDGDWHLLAKSVLQNDVEELVSKDDVEQAAVVTELGYALFGPVQEESPDIPYLYVQSLSEEALEMLPIELAEGRLPKAADEIVIPSYLSANERKGQQTKIGDTLTLELGERTLDGEHLDQNNSYMSGEQGDMETFTPRVTKSFEVVGVYSSWPSMVWGGAGYDVLAGPQAADEDGAAAKGQEIADGSSEVSGAAHVYQDVYLTMKDPRKVYQFAQETLPEYGVIYNQSLLRWLGVVDNDRFYPIITGLMAILMLVIMAGSVTLIYNAFSISLRERTVQFGLLSSLGATKKQLRSSMRYEALFVGAVGIPLGILAGIGGTGVTLHYIGKAITNWIHGVKTGIPLVVSMEAILAAAVIAFITVMVSVWIPSRRIRRISPMEAIRSNEDIKIRPKEVKTRDFVFRIFGLPGMMAEKNYKRDRKKYRATVVSLTMSIVLFMAAALFNIYLVQTGAFVLDAPDIDIRYQMYEEKAPNTIEQVDSILERTQGVVSVFPYRKLNLILQIPDEWLPGDDTAFLGADGLLKEEGKTSIEMAIIVLSDDRFAEYAEECGVDASQYGSGGQLKLMYVNEEKQYNSQTQRYERKKVFGNVSDEALDAGRFDYSGEEVSLEILGSAVLGDAVARLPKEMEDNISRAAFIPESMYEKCSGWLGSGTSVFDIRCDDPSGTFEQIEKKFDANGLDGNRYLQNLAAEYESDRNTLAAVKVLTYGFIALISLIAAANVFNTISTNLMLRRKEFAMLRSMGMSQKGFRKMMNYECLIYGMRAIFYGVILSILLGLAMQNVIGAGVDTAFLFPWKYLGIAIAGTFAVVFVTMLYTMHKLKENNIVEELKMN